MEYWCEMNNKKDLTSLFKSVKSLRAKKSTIVALEKMDGKMVFNSFDMANEISFFFSNLGKTVGDKNDYSVGYKNIQKRLMLKNISSKYSQPINKMSKKININIKCIFNLVINLNEKKSFGFDKIEP